MNLKLKYFCTLLVLVLISCQGDEAVKPFAPDDFLFNTWQITAVGSLNSSNKLKYTNFVANEKCAFDNIKFNKDQTFVATDLEFVNAICNSTQTQGTFELKDGNITTTQTNEAGVQKVVAYDVLTSTDIFLELVYSDSETQKLVFLKLSKI